MQTTALQKTLGLQLRAARIRKGLEQAQLADLAGVSRSAISGLESGTGSSLGTLMSVLEALEAEGWIGTLHKYLMIEPSAVFGQLKSRKRIGRVRGKVEGAGLL